MNVAQEEAKSVATPSAHQVLHSHNPFQDNVSLVIIVLVVHNPRAVNEEDAFHEGDVLPHLGLPRHRRYLANLHPFSSKPLRQHPIPLASGIELCTTN